MQPPAHWREVGLRQGSNVAAVLCAMFTLRRVGDLVAVVLTRGDHWRLLLTSAAFLGGVLAVLVSLFLRKRQQAEMKHLVCWGVMMVLLGWGLHLAYLPKLQQGPPGIFTPGPGSLPMPIPCQETTTATVNARGLRGWWPSPDTFDRNIPICFGDSFCFGYGVNDEDTAPALLSTYLGSGVLNAGVQGSTMRSTVLMADALLTEFPARRIVVLATLPSDYNIYDLHDEIRWRQQVGVVSLLESLLGTRLMKAVFAQLTEGPNSSPERRAHFLLLQLARLLEVAQSKQVEVVYLYGAEEAIRNGGALPSGFVVVPTVALGEDDIIQCDGHLTAQGNRRVAERIASYMH